MQLDEKMWAKMNHTSISSRVLKFHLIFLQNAYIVVSIHKTSSLSCNGSSVYGVGLKQMILASKASY
jgi:hypothetical protein